MSERTPYVDPATPGSFKPGDRVAYTPYVEGEIELGRVVRSTTSWVFVQFDGDVADRPKATPAGLLEKVKI